METKLTSDESMTSVLTFRWLDEGQIRDNDERLHHEVLQLRTNPSGGDSNGFIKIRKDDAVIMATSSGKPCMAKLHDFWQDKEGRPSCSYQWLLSASELDGNDQELHDNELVMASKLQVSDVSCIHGLLGGFQLVQHDQTWPKKAKYACRYALVIRDSGKGSLVPFRECHSILEDTANDITRRRKDSMSISDDDQSTGSMGTSSSSSSHASQRAPIVEGEGSNLRGDIQIGSKYQVFVPPFQPGIKVPSRGAKRVWSPGKVSDDDLHHFLQQLATIQTPFLKKECLTQQDPYTPLPSKDLERLLAKQPHMKFTGSSLSTASMLSGQRCDLLKECDVDAVMELINDHDYNGDKALSVAKQNIGLYCARWTEVEKSIFDENNRRSNGSFRSIKRAIAPTKNMNDIVDYHFRFKIPDQHRRYQNKKLEQAIRILECIEKKRALTPIDAGRLTAKRQKSSWAETSVHDTVGALDERRFKAKDLLMDVEKRMGKQVMEDVAVVVRHLLQSYDAETKEILFQVLHGETDLQKRFLEFLPKHF